MTSFNCPVIIILMSVSEQPYSFQVRLPFGPYNEKVAV